MVGPRLHDTTSKRCQDDAGREGEGQTTNTYYFPPSAGPEAAVPLVVSFTSVAANLCLLCLRIVRAKAISISLDEPEPRLILSLQSIELNRRRRQSKLK